MSIVLKRIYLDNFKLFEKRSIDFDRALTVFDGPNGYGKTSTFDAIELLITGQIVRVKESEPVNGNEGYGESFLAYDQNRDVVVKGEFVDDEGGESLVIARRIPQARNNIDRNPKAAFKKVKTYFPSAYDLPETKWKSVSKQAAQETCDRFFGAQNVAMYAMLHYIRQEDRLFFFKKSEKERIAELEKLLGLEEYRQKLKKAQLAQTRLHKENGQLTDRIVELREAMKRQPADAAEQTAYAAVANGKPAWDREELNFRGASSGELQQQLLEQVDGVEALFLHRREFRIDEDTRVFRAIPAEKRAQALLAWKLCSTDADAAQKLLKRQELRTFWLKQNEHILASRFERVDWKRMGEILGSDAIIAELSALGAQIKTTRANQTDLQKSMSSLALFRDQLRAQTRETELLKSGTCPYCGTVWEDGRRLEKQFDDTTAAIRAVLGREVVSLALLIEKCKNHFQLHYEEKWMGLLEDLEHDMALQVFCLYPSWQAFENAATACAPVMHRLEIQPGQITLAETLEDSLGGTARILERAGELWMSLSAAYTALDQKYKFGKLFRESFVTADALDGVSPELLEQKRRYIRSQYYHSFDAGLEELRRLETKQCSLETLCGQMKQYTETLNGAINAYRKQIISQIEIPFFLYSSRLLQSYPGGQGILINSDDGGKVRFNAPGREHDVLYTMSSGQLSAVLLAFALSLNQIYAGNGFRTLLIDDPIQCMDDINMVSLVELLGREFGQIQVILSTHEDVFSRYIGYKYGKYGLSHKSVSLKDRGSPEHEPA